MTVEEMYVNLWFWWPRKQKATVHKTKVGLETDLIFRSFGVISSSTSQKVLHYFLHAIWTLTWMRVKLEEIGEDDTQRERDIRELWRRGLLRLGRSMVWCHLIPTVACDSTAYSPHSEIISALLGIILTTNLPHYKIGGRIQDQAIVWGESCRILLFMVCIYIDSCNQWAKLHNCLHWSTNPVVSVNCTCTSCLGDTVFTHLICPAVRTLQTAVVT